MHNKSYKQLGQKECEKIYQLKQKGMTNSDIAEKLGRDKSTIGRELQRNQHLKLKQYLPDTVERKVGRWKVKGRKTRYTAKQIYGQTTGTQEENHSASETRLVSGHHRGVIREKT